MTMNPESGTKQRASAADGPPGAPPAELPTAATDDLLDRVFALYSADRAPLLRLAAIPAALTLPVRVVQRLLAQRAEGHYGSATAVAANLAVLLAAALLLLAGWGLSQAATAIYLEKAGAETAGAERRDGAWKALRQAWPYTLRYCGICLWQAGSLGWLPAALLFGAAWVFHLRERTAGEALVVASAAACAWGVTAWLRNSLAIPAAGIEALPVRAAMRRSRMLVSGRTGRVLKATVSLLLLALLGWMVASWASLYLGRARAPVQQAVGACLGFAVQFVLALVFAPVASLVFSLLYLDARAMDGRGEGR